MGKYWLYYTTKNGNPRHVVATDKQVTEGKVSAKWLGLHPSVSGTSRRGRPPAVAAVYESVDLCPLESEHEELFGPAASRAWAEPASNDSSN